MAAIVLAPRSTGSSSGVTRLAARSEAGLHLTRRGRLVLVVAALLAVMAGLMMGAGAAFGGTEPAEPASVLVVSGDTLWSVARSIAPESDPRGVIADLRELNHMADDVPLRVGQRLLVPSYR